MGPSARETVTVGCAHWLRIRCTFPESCVSVCRTPRMVFSCARVHSSTLEEHNGSECTVAIESPRRPSPTPRTAHGQLGHGARCTFPLSVLTRNAARVSAVHKSSGSRPERRRYVEARVPPRRLVRRRLPYGVAQERVRLVSSADGPLRYDHAHIIPRGFSKVFGKVMGSGGLHRMRPRHDLGLSYRALLLAQGLQGFDRGGIPFMSVANDIGPWAWIFGLAWGGLADPWCLRAKRTRGG